MGEKMRHLLLSIILSVFLINNLHADGHENKKGYVLAFLDVHNKEVMAEYKKVTGPIIKQHGGKLLAASPNPDMKEGYIAGITAIIEFASLEDARKWYDSQENQQAKAERDKGVTTIMILLEGK